MRVLHLTWSTVEAGIGGVEGHVHFLTEALKERGHDVDTVALQSLANRPGNQLSFLGETAATAFQRRREGRQLLAACDSLMVDWAEYDIIHFHDYFRITRLAAKMSSSKLVWTNHLGEFLKLQRLGSAGRAANRVLTRPFGAAIAPSRELAAAGAISAPVHYIPNGVDLSAFPLTIEKTVKRRNLGLQPDQPLVVVPRRWAPTKGVLEAAIASRAPGLRQVHFAFIGAGSRDFPEYRAQIHAALDGAENVTVIDAVPYALMAEWLGAADAVLIPSYMEATSLSALEAMSAGALVVASNVGGLPELVSHEVTGFLHTPGDVSGVVAACARILSLSVAEANTMRMRARVRAEQYAWSSIAEQTESVYRQVLTV